MKFYNLHIIFTLKKWQCDFMHHWQTEKFSSNKILLLCVNLTFYQFPVFALCSSKIWQSLLISQWNSVLGSGRSSKWGLL